jgi:pSer/pThr/pTyr-binding forkhead associated (FHA) protein
MRARLVPLDVDSPIDIDLPVVLLGQADECDVRLQDRTVADLHCVIVQTDSHLLLRELRSTGGTRVNSQQVRRAVLLPNDLLDIGRLRFRVQITA